MDFEVRNELLNDDFPGDEALDEDIRGFQIVRCDVFFDQGLGFGDG